MGLFPYVPLAKNTRKFVVFVDIRAQIIKLLVLLQLELVFLLSW